jgi:hypothetical protein
MESFLPANGELRPNKGENLILQLTIGSNFKEECDHIEVANSTSNVKGTFSILEIE